MTKHNKIIIALSVLYIVSVSAFMIAHRLWFSPDQFFVFALFGTLFLGRARLFILDWGPFLISFFSYEFLRGLIPFVSTKVHIFSMIQADQMLFGFVPTIKLQSILYNPANLQWYDYLAVTIYICHFVVPMIVAFILWLKDRKFFRDYALGFLILSYTAFFTFIVYPAMPPWMASSEGYLPPVKEVTGVVMSHFLTAPSQVPTIYSIMRANPVAAIPSLHVALPVLTLLFLLKKFRSLGLLFLPYVIGVIFAVLYLGEHYFIDTVIGAAYAFVSFGIVEQKEFFSSQWQALKDFYQKRKAIAASPS